MSNIDTSTIVRTAMLVTLGFTKGRQTKKDKNLEREICQKENSSDKMIGINRRLIVKDAFAAFDEIAKAFKESVYKPTTAWDTDGVRLCKASVVPVIMQARDKYLPRLQDAKAEIMSNYQKWKDETREARGESWNELEFPTQDEMDKKIGWTFHITPLADSSAIRHVSSISDTIMEQLVRGNDERIQQGIRDGMRQAWQELMDPINHMVETLGKDKPKIYETLVGNVRDVVARIPALNLTDDPQLAQFARQAEQMLASIDTATLRDSPVVRRETFEKARKLLDNFGAVGKRKFAA